MGKRVVLLILCLSGFNCYSFEFRPENEYWNLKRDDITEVEVRTTAPTRPYSKLGVLIARDMSGGTDDPVFISSIKDEARKRGAQGAYILDRVIRSQEVLRSNASNQSRTQTMPTGQMNADIGIVTIILYNYKESQ